MGVGWVVRVDVNREVKFCENSKKNWGGGIGSGSGWGVQGRCEQRSVVFVKIQKKIGRSGREGGGVRVDMDEELKCL